MSSSAEIRSAGAASTGICGLTWNPTCLSVSASTFSIGASCETGPSGGLKPSSLTEPSRRVPPIKPAGGAGRPMNGITRAHVDV